MLNWESIFATRSNRMRASEIRELLKLLDRPEIISFAGGIPDPELFPNDAFKEAYAEIFGGPTVGAALQYSVSEGYRPLREWLAGQMAAIGIPASVDNIFITSGSQQGLDYLGKLFLSPKDTALVTWPTYLGALQAFNAYEPTYDQLNPAGNRTPGAYAQAAEEGGGRVKFAYLSADFANPTGETVDRAGRERVLALAEELDIAVIEDAAYQSLRYDGEAVPPILALEIARKGDINNTRTIYCGSFSKTLAPGLRVGWICAAEPVIRKLVLMKQAADLHSSTINQMAIATVAERGFDEQVKKIHGAYRQRRNAMLLALERYMPAGVTWTKPEGGMFIWVTLPKGTDGAELLAKSIETAKVAFVPGRAFFADGSGENTLRLSFSCANGRMIDEGIRRLGDLVRGEVAQAA
ncbi:PLP-dependent aminotransferase family protein [Sinorhizobium medicae]|jgi:DNA-binding transcriptional MocR family regulator|uniref:Aromatic-amino-acid aminotransferase 1 n=2 Tax=Sinorhizobium medicae TaxID=110321 RepID=A0A508WZQ2_9HYPH|nr:PLP-dependent aminotransferase family protein [Sinorhizobium medicae]ABR60789.1 putative transcriptional regulator, GntR family [Sinorhizobium medicae WSM419]MBO1943892.1 PLP-dependent aminotransferase family protein [Sinorhizobium medicae]MBO1964970.1 PLP-dependent aminotransferase family protein [Sinorhizobium medicae]MDX0406947.1 aminotransferase class I/II-fold pyridoxal phosphate-dependent enzyme [Sinorhizobium medicae]MDX0412626.1 aminotransferase class I/II-fold pyridoxal phosphate-d